MLVGIDSEINKESMEKLLDICGSLLIVAKHNNVKSFTLNSFEYITVDEAEEFVEKMYQASLSELD